MIRMFINVGSVDNVNPGQIAGALYNTAKLPSGCIGTIEIFDRSSYFELPEGLADQAIRGVAEGRLRNRKLRVDFADGFSTQPPKPKFPQSRARRPRPRTRPRRPSSSSFKTRPANRSGSRVEQGSPPVPNLWSQKSLRDKSKWSQVCLAHLVVSSVYPDTVY